MPGKCMNCFVEYPVKAAYFALDGRIGYVLFSLCVNSVYTRKRGMSTVLYSENEENNSPLMMMEPASLHYRKVVFPAAKLVP